MKGKIIRYVPGLPEPTVFDVDQLPKLAFLQSAVGGYIETVPFWETYGDEPCLAFCNEEGKLLGLPYNDSATRAWHAAFIRTLDHPMTFSEFIQRDQLAGPVVVITGDAEFMKAFREGE